MCKHENIYFWEEQCANMNIIYFWEEQCVNIYKLFNMEELNCTVPQTQAVANR